MGDFTPIYDLDSLNETQRQGYVQALCKHLGVPTELNLVMLTYIDTNEGPRRLVPYAKRGAAEIIRGIKGIEVVSLTDKMIGGSIVYTAVGKDKTGRQEISAGSKYIDGLTGEALDDAIMTAQTRALRRMTLQYTGTGILDESEVSNRGVTLAMKSDTAQAPAPQPTVAPSAEPGKDVTGSVVVGVDIMHQIQRTEPHTEYHAKVTPDTNGSVTVTVPPHSGDTVKLIWDNQESFEADQAKKRAEAIASLNKTAEPEPKPRKKRERKKVDLGPSEPPVATVPVQAPPPPAPVQAPPPAIVPTVAPTPPPPQTKPVLSTEQVQPYRTRLFKITNEYLEPNGFAPREGVSNSDKMRQLATTMFGLASLKDLNIEQWEKYLSLLESKIKNEGSAATIKYIEQTIGLE